MNFAEQVPPRHKDACLSSCIEAGLYMQNTEAAIAEVQGVWCKLAGFLSLELFPQLNFLPDFLEVQGGQNGLWNCCLSDGSHKKGVLIP